MNKLEYKKKILTEWGILIWKFVILATFFYYHTGMKIDMNERNMARIRMTHLLSFIIGLEVFTLCKTTP